MEEQIFDQFRAKLYFYEEILNIFSPISQLMEEQIFDQFRANISSSVYDVVEMATKVSLAKQKELDSLEEEILKITKKIKALQSKAAQPVQIDQPIAQLDKADFDTAEFLAKCVSVCPRMTAVQLNTEGKLVCGGVALKLGDSAENIQANWDLVDTCTGADA